MTKRVLEKTDARDLSFIENSSVDLVVTSPPYNVSIDYGEQVHNDNLKRDDYEEFIESCFFEFQRVLNSSGRVCLNISLKNDNGIVDNPKLVKEIAERFKWDLRFEFIWNKDESESSTAWGSWRSPSSPRPIFNHEYIFVFDVGGKKERKEKTIPKGRFMNLVKSVWNVKPETSVNHPAPFPIEIPKRCIELNSYPGDVVLDPLCGSGTTAIAAEQMNRQWICSDKSSEYIKLSKERILNEVGVDLFDSGIFDY